MSYNVDFVRERALAIMGHMEELTDIWDQLDYYVQHKRVRPENTALRRQINEMSKAELITFCWNIHPHISKLKKRIQAEKNELQKAVLKQELEIRLLELEELKKIRDNG